MNTPSTHSFLNGKIPFITIFWIQYTNLHKNFSEACIKSLNCFISAKSSKVTTTKILSEECCQAKMTATNSARYRKRALVGPEILDGVVFPIPILPAVLKGKLKVEKE